MCKGGSWLSVQGWELVKCARVGVQGWELVKCARVGVG